jgi:hypothetical protein
MFKVQTVAFCGMTLSHGEYEDIQDARDRLARRIRWLRKQAVELTQLAPYKWEISDNGVAVEDFCGFLSIKNTADSQP